MAMRCYHDMNWDWLGRDLSIPTPLSVTHEALQDGRQEQQIRRMKPKLVNFQSYTTKKKNVHDETESDDQVSMQNWYNMSVYKRDYIKPYPGRYCTKKVETNVDPLMNRIPRNQFLMQELAGYKFMDDFFLERTPARMKVDLFRQMRNVSFFDEIMREHKADELRNTPKKQLNKDP